MTGSFLKFAGIYAAPHVPLVISEGALTVPSFNGQIFAKLTSQRKTIVLATHPIPLARAWADTVVHLVRGIVWAELPAVDFFADATLFARISPE
jgi:hypothetical protein